MDRVTMTPPPAPLTPGVRPQPRKANFFDLTAEEQEIVLAEGWAVGNDGALSPPREGGRDPYTPYSFDAPGADLSGGFGGMSMAGAEVPSASHMAPSVAAPAVAPPATPPAPAAIDGNRKPFKSAQFDQHFAVRDAPKPGFSEETAGPPSPMAEAMPEPFEAPEVTPPLAAPASARPPEGSVTQPEEPKRGLPGRLGKRMSETRPRSTSGRRRR